MADENTSGTTEEQEPVLRIEPVGLETEMQRSYLDYAMSVIVSRALPDVRDGLKPVHRRVLYAMYDGGYRPEKGFYKCARVVGDVMGTYHPHGDTSIYDALVRLAQPWSMRLPLVDSNGNFGSPGNDPAAAMRYTECKMAPLSMEMVRDIDEETVDFQDNYDGRNQEPTVLPARFPNLLVNGSAGIAVGMATNIPPHNLREVAEGAQWYLAHPEAGHEELLDALIERIKGPDFPTGALVVGRKGIEEAYRTGRGSITMRAVVEVEEIQNRQCLVVTELPYQTNPDNLAQKIADLVKDGKIGGIADVRDETSSRTGQRLVIVLKRDAVAKVVLNNLYKHTDLQSNFGANMLALVDGVPRTLSLDAFIRHWVTHQIEVIVRRTRFRLRKAEERAHILRGLLKALDAIDEVIALIRRSDTVEVARGGLMDLLSIDEIQANAILEMQLRRLAALERQKIVAEHDELQAKINEYNAILASPEKQRTIVSEELAALVERFGDDRRSKLVLRRRHVHRGPDRRGGHRRHHRARRLREADEDRGLPLAEARRQGRAGHEAEAGRHRRPLLRLHHPPLAALLHQQGPGLPGQGVRAAGRRPGRPRPARGQPPRLPAGRADRPDPGDPRLRGRAVPGARHQGRPGEEDRAQGLRLAPLRRRHRHQPARAGQRRGRRADRRRAGLRRGRPAAHQQEGAVDPLHRHGRRAAPDGTRHFGCQGHEFPRGRRTALDECRPARYVRLHRDRRRVREAHPVDEYRVQGRGGLGIKAAKIVEDRGSLVGALVVEETDEILAITLSGGVIRTRVNEVRETGRDTMGVQLINLGKRDAVVGIARNAEAAGDDEVGDADDIEGGVEVTETAVVEVGTAEGTEPSAGEHEE